MGAATIFENHRFVYVYLPRESFEIHDRESDNESVSTAKKGIPPWVWIGCGCAGAVLASLLAVMGLGLWGFHKARELGESMADPSVRTGRALEVLGADELPAGYYAVAAFSVPLVFDVAVLTDQPPEHDGELSRFGDSGFIFMSFPTFGDDELDDFFEGRTDDPGVFERDRFEVDLRERVARGRLTRTDDDILWVSYRGRVDVEAHPGTHDGLVTLMLLRCDDRRRRLGIWFGRDPDPETPPEAVDEAGTVADPKEIEAFLTPITPCG